MCQIEQLSLIFFRLSFPKILYKSVVLFSIIKVPYKDVVLSTTTCRRIAYVLTSLIIPKNVFYVCSIMLSFRLTCEINK